MRCGSRWDCGPPDRAILLDLADGERFTAPQLAEMRPVSRQAIQPVLTRLRERGLIAPHPNPRKRRSPFYGITRKGRTLLAKGRAAEAALLAGGGALPFTERELRTTLRVLERADALLADWITEAQDRAER